MAHNVETMAFTNEVPWHGLGKRVNDSLTTDDMLREAGLDWLVERRNMIIPQPEGSREFPIPVEGFAALVRDKDNAVLDVVGSRYVPTQNHEVFEFFREFVEAGSAKMDTAGSLMGGRYVWALASLGRSFKINGNDEVGGYLLAASPHQQGKSLIFKFTAVRVVCNNTLSLALRSSGGQEWRMSHRRHFDEVAIEDAKEALGIANEQMTTFEANARKLHKMKLSEQDVIRVFARAHGVEDVSEVVKDFSLAGPKLQTTFEIYKRAPGAELGTGWGALNAITYYCDHVVGRGQDRRLTNAWLGKHAVLKERVLARLLDGDI